MDRTTYELLVLDVLANAPCSFAALYGYVARQLIERRPRVAEILDVMASLEERGWVRVGRVTPDGTYGTVSDLDRARALREYRNWLGAPDADLSVDSTSLDEVGLWWELLPDGRAAASESRADAAGSQAHWRLDHDEEAGVIRVQAEDVPTAEVVMADWLRSNPGIELAFDSSACEHISDFMLRDGTRVHGGVQWESQYRRVHSGVNGRSETGGD